MRRSRHRPDPDAYVREFFRAWNDRYSSGDRKHAEIGQDGFQFWRDRWAEAHPPEPAVTAGGDASVIAKAMAQRAQRGQA
jgi:hypothetical protein